VINLVTRSLYRWPEAPAPTRVPAGSLSGFRTGWSTAHCSGLIEINMRNRCRTLADWPLRYLCD